MDFKETLNIVKKQEEYDNLFKSFPELKDNQVFKYKLFQILEVMYNLAESDGFNHGRLSKKEEMDKYMEIQQKQMDLLESISQKLKNK